MSTPHITKPLRWLLIILVIDLLFSLLWSTQVLKKTDTFHKSAELQAVVILMGNFTKDYRELGPETLKRLNFALSLKDNSTIDNYLCVGGSRPTENIIGAELMKEYLVTNGISPAQVYADGNSFDTKGNWADAVKLIEQKNWQNVGVISSAFHLYRLHKYIADTRGDTKIALIPFPYSQSTPETTLTNLWMSIHYEWMTYALYAMPEPVYNLIVSYLRPQQIVSHNA